MVDLGPIARRQRRELMAIDGDLAKALVDAYAAAWRRLKPRVDAVTADIAAAGADADPAWLIRQESLRQMEAAIVAEVTQIARSGNGAITATQWRAVQLAQEHARAFVDAAMGEPPPGAVLAWFTPPAEATRAMVGALGDGQPLTALLDALGSEAAAAVREALTTGVLLGEPVQTIARRARTAFGGNMVRAVTVSRTEVLRSYRHASWATYRANDDVVTGWIWMASLSKRTCPACLAMHGTRHRLSEEFHDHPRGRCTPVPDVKTWADLGYDVPETPQDYGDAEAWLAEQDDETRRLILGPAKAAALDAGEIALGDLAGVARSRRWGKTLRETSLTEIVGAERTRELIAGVMA